ASGLGTEGLAELTRDLVERPSGITAGRLDRLRQQVRGQVVAALGQGHLYLPSRRAVELRRTPRSRTRPAADPAILDLEQPLFQELVQVECGQLPGDTHCLGSLLPTYRLWLLEDVGVQRTPHRLVERGDRRDLRRQLLRAGRIGSLHRHQPTWPPSSRRATARAQLE